MEDFVPRKGLIEPQRLRALSRRSDRRGGLQMASHFGAIVVTGLALHATWGTWWMVPVFILHGTLINFLYAAQHELSHWTVFRTRRLNELFGRIVGFTQLYPRDFDQYQHFVHHRHTQDWEHDTELIREHWTLGAYLIYLSGITYWLSRIPRLFVLMAGGDTVIPMSEDDKQRMVYEVRWHMAGYAAIAVASLWFQSWAAVTYWLAPMILTKCVHQLQNTIEHLGLTHDDNTWLNTRTVRTNALMRWMGWNMQYHTAHHTFPSVPFYRLPGLHGEIIENTGIEPNTMSYLGFQLEVFRKLGWRRSEADFADDSNWIVEDRPGREQSAADART